MIISYTSLTACSSPGLELPIQDPATKNAAPKRIFVTPRFKKTLLPTSTDTPRAPQSSNGYAAEMRKAIEENNLEKVRAAISANAKELHASVLGESSAIVFCQSQSLIDRQDRTHITIALLELGANPQDKNIAGQTARDLAKQFYEIPIANASVQSPSLSPKPWSADSKVSKFWRTRRSDKIAILQKQEKERIKALDKLP